MKWTTANIKNSNYTDNHDIYVGTYTGSLKRLLPAYEENPFAQHNLQDVSKIEEDSSITALAFGNEEKSEILVGRKNPTVDVYSVRSEQVVQRVRFNTAPVVGLAHYGDQLIAGLANGKLQYIPLNAEDSGEMSQGIEIVAGDDMAHLRQCPTNRNLVATGGKGRQNNLKVFDIEANGKQVFTTKNLPNDYLQLEVPVWDSDVGFIDSPNVLATCSRYGYVRVYDTRKQRRPVQYFATEDHMSFTSLTARGNYIYTGTTIGALKAFDIRRMKNFVHTYKGFTGGISDVNLDTTGKYLTSSCLDRYVRVHHADSCVLLYQCYVRSKAMRVILRESMENPNKVDDEREEEGEELDVKPKGKKRKAADSDDEEYNAIFNNMQTICENNEGGEDGENSEDVEDEKVEEKPTNKMASKRKQNSKDGKTKKKKKNSNK